MQVIVITPDSIDDMDWTNPRQAKDGYTHDWWHIEVRRLLPLFRVWTTPVFVLAGRCAL